MILTEVFSIIDSFIAKQITKCYQVYFVPVDKLLPIVVAYFVTKVTDQGSIRLPHLFSGFLPVRRIGFGDINRNHTPVVPCGDAALILIRVFICKEIKSKSGLRGF